MNMYLLMITLLSIVIVILGVSWWRWHAFISLTIASLFLAIMSGMPMDKIVSAYETGVGSVLGHLVGILVLGTILGKMMAESGAGMQVAEFFIKSFGIKNLPWAMLIAGPIFAKWIHKRVIPENEPELIRVNTKSTKLPGIGVSFLVILLPVMLMVLAAAAPYVPLSNTLMKIVTLIGSPIIALLIACFAAFYFLGFRQGIDKKAIKKITEDSLLPIGSIVAIIGAGGGFKQILIDSGVGNAIAQMSEHLALSPIVLAFIVAGLIRIATGSATVALTTAAGIVSPIVENTTGVNLELLVIATGAGALMFSHVNDAGFWMVKEYLGLTVKETFKTWTVLETLLSFIAFGGVLLLDMFV